MECRCYFCTEIRLHPRCFIGWHWLLQENISSCRLIFRSRTIWLVWNGFSLIYDQTKPYRSLRFYSRPNMKRRICWTAAVITIKWHWSVTIWWDVWGLEGETLIANTLQRFLIKIFLSKLHWYFTKTEYNLKDVMTISVWYEWDRSYKFDDVSFWRSGEGNMKFRE